MNTILKDIMKMKKRLPPVITEIYANKNILPHLRYIEMNCRGEHDLFGVKFSAKKHLPPYFVIIKMSDDST